MAFSIQNIQPHLRKVIRKQIKALLQKYTDVGGRVYLCRPSPVVLSSLPCILVYLNEEPADHNDSAPRIYTREGNFIIEILQADGDSIERSEEVEDFLDSRSFEVEYALLNDVALELGNKGEWIQDVELVSTISAKQIYEGVATVAALKQLYKVSYETEHFQSETPGEFLSFDAKYKDLAEDEVNVRS